ncbi:cysteine proteinase [Hypomontagnella submonticulosa]|nr:cysteine proteinase [Hypomontagnella submonticulosa]
MPGEWPATLDEEDDSAHNTFFQTPIGANIRHAVTYLRDRSYDLCTNLSNRIIHTVHRRRRTPTRTFVVPDSPIPDSPVDTASPPQDGSPAPKRRRISEESSIGDIDSPIRMKASPSLSPVISPNSAAAAAAARRAIKFFPKGRRNVSKRVQTQAQTPPPEPVEKPVQQTEPRSELGPPGPPKYKNIQEFFEHDHEICLPGLENFSLLTNHSKLIELGYQREERLRIEEEKAEQAREEEKRQEEERLRIEEEKAEQAREEERRQEEERYNESLRSLGLRRARQSLITPLSPEWEQKARESADNGHAEQNKWQRALHRDGVELTARDFSKLVCPGVWLNDNAIQATLVHLATYINDAAGVVPKTDTPRCVALSSQYWSNFRADPRNHLYPRGLNRNWGVKPENFLDIDTVLIPVNENNHWTLLVIRPARRTVAYVDSFHSAGERHLEDAHQFLKTFLGEKYVASEWRTETYTVPSQTNGYDCGMFVITNSIYLALGIDPSSYSQQEMDLQRLRIGAVCLHGGFTGPFDLSGL